MAKFKGETKAKYHLTVFLALFAAPLFVNQQIGMGLYFWLSACIPWLYLFALVDDDK
ncbi:hypothetical protein N9Z13_06965 [Luminiphilus sp.]|nr:hypothetical protein [Luminiphilus sp.]